MQLTQALTLVPERQREEKEDIGSAEMPMDKIIEFLTGPVRDIPLIEFDLPKILAFYSKKGKEDNEVKDSMAGVRQFLRDSWNDAEEEDNLLSHLIEKVVTTGVRKLGSFLARVIFGTIWRITKWLVKEVVGGVIKNLLRWLVMPVIEAVVGFLLTPVGLALAITGGVIAGAYFVYKAFFSDDKEKPKTKPEEDDISKPEGGDSTVPAASLLRQPETTSAAPQSSTSVASAPPRTSEASLSTPAPAVAAAPQPAGAPVAASAPPSDIKKMIMRHEGIRTKPYKDSLGLWTIGVGHLIGDGKSLPPEWNRELSMDEVSKLFDGDYEKHKKIAMRAPNFNRFNEQGQGALIDLAFNMGQFWSHWPSVKQALEDFDVAKLIERLRAGSWYKQVGPSRAGDIFALLSSNINSTQVVSGDSVRMSEGTTTAATKQNQIKDAQAANHPGTAVPPPPNDKTIIKTPSGKLVAANM